MNSSSTSKGYIALGVTSIVWGTTWIASKIGIADIHPLQMAYIRQFIGGAVFVLFFLVAKKLPFPTGKQFLWLTVMALLMFVSANGLSTWSIKFIPAGLSALIGAMYPLCVVIIEKVFFKSRKLTALTFAGLLLGIVGIAIVFYENAFQKGGSSFLFGVMLSTIAMLSWSVGTIFIARNKTDINPYYGVGWQMLLSSGFLLIIAKATVPIIPVTAITTNTWLAIIYLVVLGSLVAFVAFIYSMKTLSPAVAALYAYINPLIAMICGHWLISEKLSLNIIWGSVITLTGVYLVNHSIRKEEKLIEPEQ